MPEMKTLTILGKTYEVVDAAARTSIEELESKTSGASSTSVSYEAQTLTPAQKRQARNNIDAISSSDADSMISNATDGIFNTTPKATLAIISQVDGAITVSTKLSNGETVTSVVTIDENGYPTSIDTDGVLMTISWTGQT